jgi:hypothetical protein
MKKIILYILIVLLTGSQVYAVGRFHKFGADNDFDGEDLAIFSQVYEIQHPQADLNRDNMANVDDVAILAAGFGQVNILKFIYDVGPGQPYADPSAVPWEALQPGSLVRIHYRTQPYAHKWVIAVAGTAEAPIMISGVPQEGKLPVITGENAVTRLELDYWNENRSVIKIGGSSSPSQFPAHIVIENLEIRSARPPFAFTDDRGNSGTYQTNAAAIHVEMGDHITIRNCILHDCGNGFFSGSQSSSLLLERNYVYANGIEGSIYHHNSYTESLGIVFQFNRYGPLRAGCRGNNLKDRSAGTIIRYNWIEAGNRTLDLVDSDHAELFDHPSYLKTYVFGNTLIKHDVQENSQVMHYGGDSGIYGQYRKGTLWFYNNTVVSYRSENTTLFGLDTNDEHVEAFNNIVYVTAAGSRLAIMGEKGVVNLHDNWLPSGWVEIHGTLQGSLTAENNTDGDFPGFNDFSNQDYSLSLNSPCIDAGTALPTSILPNNNLSFQYVPHQDAGPRPTDDRIDQGTFEYD